jgi:EpsI family protein
MDSQILRRYLPAILLLVGVLLVWSTRSQSAVPLAGSMSGILPTYGDYRVTQQKVSEEERKVAGMSDYVARAFWKDSEVAFTTYVGYYDRQTQGKTIHSPRNCLPGAGWEILSADTASLMRAGQRVLVNKYTLKNGPMQAIVYYWYQGRGRVVASEFAVKWNLLRDAALIGHTEEALVRVVVYPRGQRTAKGPKQLAAAVADAERLGMEIGTRLLDDVGRVLPPSTTAERPTASASVAVRMPTSR